MSPDGSQNIKFAFDLEGKELIIRYSAFPDVPRLPTRKPQRCAWPRSRFLIQRAPWGLICGGSELDLELQRRLPPLRIRWPVWSMPCAPRELTMLMPIRHIIYYEEQYRSRVIQNLKRKAREFGFELVTMQQASATMW